MSESELIERARCPRCALHGNDTSGDNLAIYSDGHGWCYACHYYQKGESTYVAEPKIQEEFTPVVGTYQGLKQRGINEDTCRHYGYQVFSHNGKDYHVAPYYKSEDLIAQHFRSPEKKFWWKGNTQVVELFGQNRFEKGGKRLVITEGEIDAMSVYQMNGGWPVVSIPSGTSSAESSIKNNLEFVLSYDEVILMFDMDDPGQEAAKRIATLLPPGKVKIAKLPRKDANECLLAGEEKQVKTAIFQAHLYAPDEIIHASQVSNDDSLEGKKVWSFPWDTLTQKLVGQRSGEITLWVAGSGSGKSTVVRELAYHHLVEGRSVGMLMFEESEEETLDDLVSLMINAPVRIIKAANKLNKLREEKKQAPIWVSGSYTEEEYLRAREWLQSKPLYFYNHEGNNAYRSAIARMEYLAISLGVDVIILDHITALALGMLEDNNDNERMQIDTVMKDFRSLVTRTGVRIDVVSQLKKGTKSFENGDPIGQEDIRGSACLYTVPNTIIGMERNRQHPDVFISNCTSFRVIKNRLTGQCGVMGGVYYNSTNGRLDEVETYVTQDDDRWGNTKYITNFRKPST